MLAFEQLFTPFKAWCSIMRSFVKITSGFTDIFPICKIILYFNSKIKQDFTNIIQVKNFFERVCPSFAIVVENSAMSFNQLKHFVKCHFVKCHIVKCHIVKCHFVKCHFVKCHFVNFRFISPLCKNNALSSIKIYLNLNFKSNDFKRNRIPGYCSDAFLI